MATELSLASEVKQIPCEVKGVRQTDGTMASVTLVAPGYALTIPPTHFPFIQDGEQVFVTLQVIKVSAKDVSDLPQGLASSPVQLIGKKSH